MTAPIRGTGALEALYWRSEILQAMYWMRGERLAADVDPLELARFLAADPATVHRHLRQLAEEGFVDVVPGRLARYELTSTGAADGARSFRDEFEGLTRAGHGECGPGCWCQDPKRSADPCPGGRDHVHGV
ncbi:MAG: winged helix-turn-helix domain-containing protein [Chloroflexota bacterium]